jgi:hypothetical protein
MKATQQLQNVEQTKQTLHPRSLDPLLEPLLTGPCPSFLFTRERSAHRTNRVRVDVPHPLTAGGDQRY